MTLERCGVRGALVGVMYAMGLVATVAWVLTATQMRAVKLERLKRLPPALVPFDVRPSRAILLGDTTV
jgi:cytochrome c biogenesis protein CcdA